MRNIEWLIFKKKWLKKIIFGVTITVSFLLLLFVCKTIVNSVILSKMNNIINDMEGSLDNGYGLTISSISKTKVKAADEEKTDETKSLIKIRKDPFYFSMENSEDLNSTYLIEENGIIYKYERNNNSQFYNYSRIYGDFYAERAGFNVDDYIESTFNNDSTHISINSLEAITYRWGKSYVIIQSFENTLPLEAEEYSDLLEQFDQYYNVRDLKKARTTITMTPKENGYSFDIKVDISTKIKWKYAHYNRKVKMTIDIATEYIYSEEVITESCPTLLLRNNMENALTTTINHDYYLYGHNGIGYTKLYLESGNYILKFRNEASYSHCNSEYFSYELYDENKNLLINSNVFATNFTDYIFEIDNPGYYYIKFISYDQSGIVNFEIDKLEYRDIGQNIVVDSLDDIDGVLEGSDDYLVLEYYSDKDMILELKAVACELIVENSSGEYFPSQIGNSLYRVEIKEGKNYIKVISYSVHLNNFSDVSNDFLIWIFKEYTE